MVAALVCDVFLERSPLLSLWLALECLMLGSIGEGKKHTA